MLSRSLHTTVVGRSASMRRLRRRTHGHGALYCGTNGCPTTLTVDPERGVAYCEVCGYTRILGPGAVGV